MAVLSLCTDIKTLIEYHAGICIVGKPVRVRNVLEYHSNCPWCGGTDRFITRPEEGTYSCSIRASGCDAGGDMITFLREYCNMTFWEACDELGIDPNDLGDYVQHQPSAQAYGSPSKQWQERGDQMVAKAQSVLRLAAGSEGLAYLRARGLTDGTLLDKGLGYIPLGTNDRWHSSSLEEWGLTAEGTGKNRVWQPEGILIPWYAGGKLWKLDVRRLNGLKKEDPKILSITGSVDCLYNHDLVTVDKPVVLVESALCALSGEQEATDLATFVATGGAGKHRPSWAKHLDQAPFVLVALDNDEPDERGIRPGDEGAAWWEKNLSHCIRWLPWKKDINDMLRGGIDIREWVQDGIDFYNALKEAKNVSAWEEPVTEPIPVVNEPAPDSIEEPRSHEGFPEEDSLQPMILTDEQRMNAARFLKQMFDGTYPIDAPLPDTGPLNGIMSPIFHDAYCSAGAAAIPRAIKTLSVDTPILADLLAFPVEPISKERPPYAPVSLPPLPRSTCPCITLGWNAKGKQTKQSCKGKVTENGFCEEHRPCHDLLEIGAKLGYPEVRVPFRWKKETLHRTIYAGVSCWEDVACTFHADHPNKIKENIDYLRREYAAQINGIPGKDESL